MPGYLLSRVFIFIKCCIFSDDYQSLSLIRLLLELTFFSVSRERAGLRLTIDTNVIATASSFNSTLILYQPFSVTYKTRPTQIQFYAYRNVQWKSVREFNLIIAVNSVLCPVIFRVSLVLKTGRIYYYFWSTRITIFFFEGKILSSTVTVTISQTAGFTHASKAAKTIAGPVCIVQLSELHCTAANSQGQEFQITLSSSGQVHTNCIQRFRCFLCP